MTACKLHSDKEATWRNEFAKWCAAFYAFKQEYNHWLCLKVSTLRNQTSHTAFRVQYRIEQYEVGTLAVDGWAVTFGTARRRLGGRSPLSPLLAVPNVAAHPPTASVPTTDYRIAI